MMNLFKQCFIFKPFLNFPEQWAQPKWYAGVGKYMQAVVLFVFPRHVQLWFCWQSWKNVFVLSVLFPALCVFQEQPKET